MVCWGTPPSDQKKSQFLKDFEAREALVKRCHESQKAGKDPGHLYGFIDTVFARKPDFYET